MLDWIHRLANEVLLSEKLETHAQFGGQHDAAGRLHKIDDRVSAEDVAPFQIDHGYDGLVNVAAGYRFKNFVTEETQESLQLIVICLLDKFEFNEVFVHALEQLFKVEDLQRTL